MHEKNAQRLATMALLAMAILWGLTFPVINRALDSMSPPLFVAVRFSLATLLCLPFIRNLTMDKIKRGILIGLTLFGGYFLQTWGLNLTSPARSAFLTSLYVILVPFLGFFWREKPTIFVLLGSLFAVAGALLLARPEGGGFGAGDWITVGCAICFGFQIVFVQRLLRPGEEMTLAAIQYIVVAIGAFLLAPAWGKIWWDIDLMSVGALLFTAVIATWMALWFQFRFQRYLSTGAASIIYTSEMGFAAIFGYLFFNQTLSVWEIGGGILIALAVLVATLLPRLFRSGK